METDMKDATKANSFSWEQFLRLPLVGIVRNIPLDEVVQVLPLYQGAGLTTIEITMNSPDAEEIIRTAIHRHGGGLNIGAGTVCNMGDLKRALEAGAQFIVTPTIGGQIISACVRSNVPIFPGAFTPTEIYKAWALGASMVKLFPAAALGPGYIREMKGPFNQIKLLPTGGVNLENGIEFLRAGAAGVGMGSQLFNKKWISGKNWEALAKNFEHVVRKLNVRQVL
jgi:2-dehydro-3-deoxyphosphogluconate aldolase/(4S)-4-hydroxy-2-oxoglutarate aldolase